MSYRLTARKILALLGGLPLLFCTPYIFRAWQNSPLDRRDCIFGVAFGLSALIALAFSRPGKPFFQLRVLFAALIFLAGYLGCLYLSINAGAIVCAIMFWWLFVWLAHSDRLAYNLLPSFFILLLSVVSSTYWLCVFFGFSASGAFWLKVAVLLLLLALEAINLWKGWMPKMGLLLFGMGMVAATAVMLQLGNLAPRHAPLLPQNRMLAGEFLGRELPADEGFRRFFQNSDAHNHRYVGPDNWNYSMLSVQCGSDIHEIHPASHCLRSAGWKIDSERQRDITLRGKTYNVTEVQGHLGKSEMLLWVWYSNEKYSTGNFISFRRWWTGKEKWSTYQLGVYGNAPLEERREHLLALLAELSKARADAVPIAENATGQ